MCEIAQLDESPSARRWGANRQRTGVSSETVAGEDECADRRRVRGRDVAREVFTRRDGLVIADPHDGATSVTTRNCGPTTTHRHGRPFEGGMGSPGVDRREQPARTGSGAPLPKQLLCRSDTCGPCSRARSTVLPSHRRRSETLPRDRLDGADHGRHAAVIGADHSGSTICRAQATDSVVGAPGTAPLAIPLRIG